MTLLEFIAYLFWAKPKDVQRHEDGYIFWFDSAYPIWRITVGWEFLGFKRDYKGDWKPV